VPCDFGQRGTPVLAKLSSGAIGVMGLLRDFMIVTDAKHYFTACWHLNFSATAEEFPLPNEDGVTKATLHEFLQP